MDFYFILFFLKEGSHLVCSLKYFRVIELLTKTTEVCVARVEQSKAKNHLRDKHKKIYNKTNFYDKCNDSLCKKQIAVAQLSHLLNLAEL